MINGTKNWITNAGVADFYVVFAMTSRGEEPYRLDAGGSGAAGTRSRREARRSTAFVVESDREGFSVVRRARR